MNRNRLVWIFAIFLTLIQTYFLSKSETIPLRKAEVFVNNHVYNVSLLRNYVGDGDAKLKIRLQNREVSGRIYYRNYKSNDEWIYCDLVRENDFLVGSLPRRFSPQKIEYYIEFIENSEIASVERNHPTILTFEEKIPNPLIFINIIAIFTALLLSNISGLYVIVNTAKYKLFTIYTFNSLLFVAFVLTPILRSFSLRPNSISASTYLHFVSVKFSILAFTWLAMMLVDRKINKPLWISATSLVFFISTIIPTLLFD